MMVPMLAAARASLLLVLSSASFQVRSYPAIRSSSLLASSSFSTRTTPDDNNLVSSTKSNTVKKIQALLTKRKKRVELGETIVEGPRMVFDLLADSNTRGLVKQVLISTDKWQEYQDEWHAALDASAKDIDDDDDGEDTYPPTVVAGTPEVLKACTDTVTNQGIVAIVDIPNLPLEPPPPASCPLYLILDGVADPGNLGTLLRSSVATGTAAVILLPGSCDPWNPKAVRSAMGTSFRLPVHQVASWDECSKLLKNDLQCHNSTFAATMLEDIAGTCHYNVDWTTGPTALIVGSEGNGLSKEVRQAIRRADDDDADGNDQTTMVQAVHVPMQAGIESLNAAVCGSVILFESLRQRQQQVEQS